MEDKRIIKTKKNIKNTLIKLLEDNSLENISVSSICEKGVISRITFYKHYANKYDVIKEINMDYADIAAQIYMDLQKENNKDDNGKTGYHNLLEAILIVFYKEYSYFRYTINPYMHSRLYAVIYDKVYKYIDKQNSMTPNFPMRQTVNLVVNSMIGVIDSSIIEGMNAPEVKKIAHEMFECLLTSSLFS